MENKLITLKQFIKNMFNDEDIDEPTYKKNKLFEKNEINVKQQQNKYISRTYAIEIANQEKNLRKSMYIEAKRNGYYYGLIEIEDYYATLVKYNNNYAWYIKVITGKYVSKNNNKYYKGYYDENSNISCLVIATTGEYLYLGTDFDTRNIKMVTDDEYLEFITNVRG